MLLRTHWPIICKAIIANSNRISYNAVQSTGQRGERVAGDAGLGIVGMEIYLLGASVWNIIWKLVRRAGDGQSVLIESCACVHPPPLIFHF